MNIKFDVVQDLWLKRIKEINYFLDIKEFLDSSCNGYIEYIKIFKMDFFCGCKYLIFNVLKSVVVCLIKKIYL